MPVHAISVLNDTSIQIKIDSFRIEHTYLRDGFLLSAQTTSTPERERGKINEIEATTDPHLIPCSLLAQAPPKKAKSLFIVLMLHYIHEDSIYQNYE